MIVFKLLGRMIQDHQTKWQTAKLLLPRGCRLLHRILNIVPGGHLHAATVVTHDARSLFHLSKHSCRTTISEERCGSMAICIRGHMYHIMVCIATASCTRPLHTARFISSHLICNLYSSNISCATYKAATYPSPWFALQPAGRGPLSYSHKKVCSLASAETLPANTQIPIPLGSIIIIQSNRSGKGK